MANIALLAGPKTLSHDNNAMISIKNKGNHDSVVSSKKESKNCFVEFDECAYVKALEEEDNSDEDKNTMSLSECNIVVEISPLLWKTLTLIFFIFIIIAAEKREHNNIARNNQHLRELGLVKEVTSNGNAQKK